MSDTDYLVLQATIVCLFLFFVGTSAIMAWPEWFE
jgi:hypothetical protein